jgi:hypothetical protein
MSFRFRRLRRWFPAGFLNHQTACRIPAYRGIAPNQGYLPAFCPNAEFDQAEISTVRIQNGAGAVLRLEAGNPVVAQGMSDSNVNSNKVRHDHRFGRNSEKCLQ